MRRHNYEQFMKDSVIGLMADCVYFCYQNSVITDDEDLALYSFLKVLYKYTPYKNVDIIDIKDNFGYEVDIPDFMKKDNVVKFERRKDEV